MENALKYVRCDACRGKKIVNGLGGMPKDCGTCKGIGHVSLDKALGDAVDKCETDVLKTKRAKIQAAPALGDIDVDKIQRAVDAVSDKA